MTKKITIVVLKRYLKNLLHQQLVEEIVELFGKFPVVRDYYQIKIGGGEGPEILRKYKAIIDNEFFPSRGLGKGRLSAARKAISDFKKICQTHPLLADLTLYSVERALEYARTYGGVDESFAGGLVRMYDRAVGVIVRHNLREVFQARCEKLTEEADIGHGVDALFDEIYFAAYGDLSTANDST